MDSAHILRERLYDVEWIHSSIKDLEGEMTQRGVNIFEFRKHITETRAVITSQCTLFELSKLYARGGRFFNDGRPRRVVNVTITSREDLKRIWIQIAEQLGQQNGTADTAREFVQNETDSALAGIFVERGNEAFHVALTVALNCPLSISGMDAARFHSGILRCLDELDVRCEGHQITFSVLCALPDLFVDNELLELVFPGVARGARRRCAWLLGS